MNDIPLDKITAQNEDFTRDWFELSDFHSERLDKKGKNKQKTPDWKFQKNDVTVFCEVKTVFSGGQQRLTREQYERQRLADNKQIDAFAKRLPAGQPLIVPKDYFEYLQGKKAYTDGPNRKEQEFQNFLYKLKDLLESDGDIRFAPFHITIGIGGLFVPIGEVYIDFCQWLKGYVLWAQQNHVGARNYSNSAYIFQHAEILKDGSHQPEIEAFVQMSGPYTEDRLHVGFIQGGATYHEQKVSATINEAMRQLPLVSVSDTNSIATIALWSESSYLRFSQVLIDDAIDKQLGRIGPRYYLFDWAFSKYPHLAAIILCEQRPIKKYENLLDFMIDPPTEFAPAGCVITNPSLPNHAEVLRQNILQNCTFIKGTENDPLSDRNS